MDGKDTGSGGGRPEDILFVFVGGRPGNVAFRFGDVGPELPYKAVPGKLPESVSQWITGRYPMRQGEGDGSIFLWRQKGRGRVLKISGYTPKGGRIWSRNILRRDRVWTSVSALFEV